MRIDVAYLCNGKNPECSGKIGCYILGGECRRTSKPEYRKTEGEPKFITDLVEGDRIVLTEIE